jgi:hypothetical protein
MTARGRGRFIFFGAPFRNSLKYLDVDRDVGSRILDYIFFWVWTLYITERGNGIEKCVASARS